MKRASLLLLAFLPVVPGAVWILLPHRADSRPPVHRAELRPGAAELQPPPPDSPRAAAQPETPENHSAGFYSLPEGRSFEMRFSSSFASELLQAGSESGTRIELALEGTMNVLVLQATENELVLRSSLSLARVGVSASGERLPDDSVQALSGELSRPALVRLDRSGKILGYRFDPAAQPENRNLVRTLWYAVRDTIDPDRARWLADEADSTGPCLVEYEWLDDSGPQVTPRRLARTKLAYAELALAPRIPLSRGENRMSLVLRWPLDGRHEERVELPLDGAGSMVRVEANLTFTLVRDGLVEGGALTGVDPSIPWESAGGERETADPSRFPSDVDMVAATTTLDAVLGMIESQLTAGLLESSGLHDSQRVLAELVRRDPADLDRLRSLLPGLSSKASMVVLAAVGMAQTEESQSFLGGVVRDSGEQEELRIYANLSAHQVERPTTALLEALSVAIQEPECPRRVRSSGLLALGDLASRAAPEPSEAALALLLASRGEDSTPDDLVVWLEALGNSGSDRILPAVADFLAHGDERVRASAASALRFLAPAEATQLLVTALDDPSARVRTTAAEELAAKDSPEALRAIEEFLAAESSAAARKRAVAAFGMRQVLDEGARAILMRVSASDADAAVRQLALEILGRG